MDGKNAVTNVAGNNYTYDGNGNLTGLGFLLYDYDVENQLRTVTNPNTQKADFTYDGRGRLRKRIEAEGSRS